jgi:membrane protease YdiL (CAAX protease family)
LFSLAHWCTGPGFLLTSFIYGLFFAILYLRTRNIFLLILVHTTIDLMIF